ncbi:uncharacterized protein [Blastocystis hominis]|uniref:Large ribosomal subunit protein bL28m n=1 Tax=Blastocystis hominis TaxID=12968 RepID=D8M961_BLAHO|nr:uncharacterized protein [Blastocystis hominis]CBK24600.2 unnamed protein product [Blastocystis hominis]|eukprot:XP_012898648.1 uncharacterized protein [Blastocystis hominis]
MNSILGFVSRSTFKRARRGLFGTTEKLFGNNVSHSERKTRRDWNPNVRHVHLYSETLDRKIGLRVTSNTLRCIDKAGGLDYYVLNTKDKDLNSDVALRLREEILAKQRELNGKLI